MKLVTIQVQKNDLRIALVKYQGTQRLVEKMRSFDLPDDLTEGRYASEPQALSDFIASSIERGRLPSEKAILLLGASSVIHKEYTHGQVKKTQLLALANMEAESSLPEDEGEYIIENQWYGTHKNKEGMQTSAIFASADAYITDLVGALRRAGVRVIGAYSSLNVYSRMMGELVNSGSFAKIHSGKTLAAVDITHPEIRLAIYNKGQLIHQRMDEQLMEEFFRAASSAYRVPVSTVGRILSANGFLEAEEENREDPEALSRITQAAGLVFSRLLRSINILLDSLDLTLDYILISGEGAAFPGFVDFIGETSGISVGSVDEFHSEFSEIVDLAGELSDRKDLYSSILMLSGIGSKDQKKLNFLTRGVKRKKSARMTRLICALILLLTLVVMSLLPINYFITVRDLESNRTIMENPDYVAARQLIEEHRMVRTRLSEIEAEKARLPFGNSDTSKDLTVFNENLFTNVFINELRYDKTTDKYSGMASVNDPKIFIDAKNRLNKDERYKVSVPMTIFKADNNWYCMFEVETIGEEGTSDEVN